MPDFGFVSILLFPAINYLLLYSFCSWKSNDFYIISIFTLFTFLVNDFKTVYWFLFPRCLLLLTFILLFFLKNFPCSMMLIFISDLNEIYLLYCYSSSYLVRLLSSLRKTFDNVFKLCIFQLKENLFAT